MSNKECKNNIMLKKQGNIFIPIGLVILIIIFATTFLVYYQVNIIVENIRRDLFYASNNAILSFDLEDLAYKKYTVNQNETKQVIEDVLAQNYTATKGSITKIEVIDLDVTQEQDKVNLDVKVKVTFKSVINLIDENEHEFTMSEQIKISLLEYKIGETYE